MSTPKSSNLKNSSSRVCSNIWSPLNTCLHSNLVLHIKKRFKPFEDDRLMFYQNMEIKSPRRDLCEASSKSLVRNTDWCTTNNFRLQTLSSNNPDYLIDKKGYLICEKNTEHDIVLLKVSYWVHHVPYMYMWHMI